MMETASPTTLQQALQWAQLCFYAVTAVSILAAGLLAALRYRLFRAGRPSLTIALTASSRPSSPSYVQVGVTARLHNASRVLAKVDDLEWECRILATYDDADIDAKIAEYFNSGGGYARTESRIFDFPWNVHRRIAKSDLGILVEPNETGHDSVSFVLPIYCAAVQIRLHILNRKGGEVGWAAVIFHDLETGQGLESGQGE